MQITPNIIPLPQKMTVSPQHLNVGPLIFKGEARLLESEDHAISKLIEWVKSIVDEYQENTHVWIVYDGQIVDEGYKIEVNEDCIRIIASSGRGVYYALQTLKQSFRSDASSISIPIMSINDWPTLKYRAAHYDMKHHQSRLDAIKSLIEDLGHYKINYLVWEWEDKLAYKCYPEIGAPGAISIDEMKDITAFAKMHHIQIIPLVQGLAHVSFVLKHPRFFHLREIPDSNWQFCPLKDESYEVLFNIWKDAVEATPGSEFLHIGTDETYELGLGVKCGCNSIENKEGKNALMQRFIHRCVDYVENVLGRKVLSWGGQWNENQKIQPPKSMIFTDSDDVDYLKKAKDAGYPGWVYAPNPGIVPLALPLYDYTHQSYEPGAHQCNSVVEGTIKKTINTIGYAGREILVNGSITTTWDDSGHHLLAWIPRLICAADFSWNCREESVDADDWLEGFYENYFGRESKNLAEFFRTFYEGADFYYHVFQRSVWHWYTSGRMELPEPPKNIDLEFNNFWRIRHHVSLCRANDLKPCIERSIKIIDQNLSRNISHKYDLQIYKTCLELIQYDVDSIILFAEIEEQLCHICGANEVHFQNNNLALENLNAVLESIKKHYGELDFIYKNLIDVWEKTRLPKGLNLSGKKFVFARDRARHFANRTADMKYLIIDQRYLGYELFIEALESLIVSYEKYYGGIGTMQLVHDRQIE